MSNTIIRAPHRDRCVTIDQRAIEDRRLSWAARGLLSYMLSRSDDWKVSVNDLCRRGDLGRDGIYRLLRDLRETGYVRLERYRDPQGRIRGSTYIVQEIPLDSPDTDWADVAELDSAEPHPDDPAVLTTDELILSGSITTTPVASKAHRRRGEAENSAVEFIAWVPEKVRDVALDAVAHLNTVDAQIVIDEWAGRVAAGLINASPFDDLRVLVSQYEEGCCALVLAEDIKGLRAKPVPEGGYIGPDVVWEAGID